MISDDDNMRSYNYQCCAFPSLAGVPLWQRVLCVLQYHKREKRVTGPKHKYPGTALRDQCGRCGALL